MVSTRALWAGRLLSGLAILFLLFDGLIKLPPLEIVTTTSKEMGLPATASFARFLGVVTLACTALYAWPRTALLTGLFGGAIATHLKLDSPLFSHTLFGLYLGLMVWGGLWLRDERVRRVMPFLA